MPPPKKFADSLTADHMILSQEDSSRKGSRVSLVILDRFCQWLQAYGANTNSGKTTRMAFQRFLGPQTRAEHVYSDGSKEIKKAMEDLSFTHDCSTPHRPQTNGVAERAVRKAKEGTSATLVQSGFHHAWWEDAQSCFCFLHCVIDLQKEI